MTADTPDSLPGLLALARDIWGPRPALQGAWRWGYVPLVSAALAQIGGDIAAHAISHMEDASVNEIDLKGDLGNLLLSAVRWIDDLGLDIGECVQLAAEWAGHAQDTDSDMGQR